MDDVTRNGGERRHHREQARVDVRGAGQRAALRSRGDRRWGRRRRVSNRGTADGEGRSSVDPNALAHLPTRSDRDHLRDRDRRGTGTATRTHDYVVVGGSRLRADVGTTADRGWVRAAWRARDHGRATERARARRDHLHQHRAGRQRHSRRNRERADVRVRARQRARLRGGRCARRRRGEERRDAREKQHEGRKRQPEPGLPLGQACLLGAFMCGMRPQRTRSRGVTRARTGERYSRPTALPSGVRSMPKAFGSLGRPGSVMISPARQMI